MSPPDCSPTWRWEERANDWLNHPLGTLLDYGCGPCRFLELVQDRASECHGVDVDVALIDEAKNRHPQFNLRVIGSDGRTNYPDNHFDTVTLLEVIEHVPDERTTLNEVARVLKPGGTLLLTTPHRGLLTFLDAGNFKFLFPTLHRFMHVHILRNQQQYHERFERVAERGLIGDIAVTTNRRPWHRHYSPREICRLKPECLDVKRTAVYFPAMRAISLLQAGLHVMTAGRMRRLPGVLSRLERRLSHVESSVGDQLVMLLIKRVP